MQKTDFKIRTVQRLRPFRQFGMPAAYELKKRAYCDSNASRRMSSQGFCFEVRQDIRYPIGPKGGLNKDVFDFKAFAARERIKRMVPEQSTPMISLPCLRMKHGSV
ncbi:hypothetical protein MsAg5_14030 [Methanosarcinaceae archaeon Ag5]|uniref:Uncharacterized protein n=1 Tax=Methanolapillus africanus TaxID=3028297 RepID=A0AAE4SED7_9EURY|nr:hypothetical protein [Methanosarcinaceae archaeon Ag5]